MQKEEVIYTVVKRHPAFTFTRPKDRLIKMVAKYQCAGDAKRECSQAKECGGFRYQTEFGIYVCSLGVEVLDKNEFELRSLLETL